ncbi:MAG: type II CAAX endopeptidase family protein [Dictyoglomaceae bacterium]|nr:type II CAAX endopeptidase family protein [Dictyoglomaceae bacterium]HPU44247.1 type II CAAX endopeptidase family protein [Dictyoglomaceae bacterium]
MLNLLLTVLVLATLYLLIFKLLPVVGAIPFLLAKVKSSDITGIRLFILTIIYVPLALLIIHGVMHIKGYGLPELLLPMTGSDVYFGLAAGIVIALLNLSIDLALKKKLNENFASTLKQIGNSTSGLIAMIGVSWLAGGILEEVFWRGFWFSEWTSALGNNQSVLIFCVISSGIFFGLNHLYEGISGTVSSGVAGMCLGLLYLWRGNLVAPIMAHGIMDTLLLLIIWFRFGRSQT